MPKPDDERMVETSTRARRAERGPTVLATLVISTGLAVLLLAIVSFVLYRV